MKKKDAYSADGCNELEINTSSMDSSLLIAIGQVSHKNNALHKRPYTEFTSYTPNKMNTQMWIVYPVTDRINNLNK